MTETPKLNISKSLELYKEATGLVPGGVSGKLGKLCRAGFNPPMYGSRR